MSHVDSDNQEKEAQMTIINPIIIENTRGKGKKERHLNKFADEKETPIKSPFNFEPAQLHRIQKTGNIESGRDTAEDHQGDFMNRVRSIKLIKKIHYINRFRETGRSKQVSESQRNEDPPFIGRSHDG